MQEAPSTSWLRTSRSDSGSSMRLFCFPPAGSGASLFHGWSDALPSMVEVSAVQLPGRESRIRDEPFLGMDALVDAALLALQPAFGEPFAFFGYSLGGWVCFELARRLQSAGGPRPSHLFVGGCGAPQVSEPNRHIHGLPDDEFLEAVRSLNGFPEEALNHSELVALVLPTLRADFTVYETYSYRAGPLLDCPISAYGGCDDPRVLRSALEAWQEQTTQGFELQMFDGDHSFLNTERNDVLRAISRGLQRAG